MPLFKKWNINSIIRSDKPVYNKNMFSKNKFNKPLNKDAFITKMDFNSKTFGKR